MYMTSHIVLLFHVRNNRINLGAETFHCKYNTIQNIGTVFICIITEIAVKNYY